MPPKTVQNVRHYWSFNDPALTDHDSLRRYPRLDLLLNQTGYNRRRLNENKEVTRRFQGGGRKEGGRKGREGERRVREERKERKGGREGED